MPESLLIFFHSADKKHCLFLWSLLHAEPEEVLLLNYSILNVLKSQFHGGKSTLKTPSKKLSSLMKF